MPHMAEVRCPYLKNFDEAQNRIKDHDLRVFFDIAVASNIDLFAKLSLDPDDKIFCALTREKNLCPIRLDEADLAEIERLAENDEIIRLMAKPLLKLLENPDFSYRYETCPRRLNFKAANN